MRLIALEFVDQRSPQQMQEAAALVDGMRGSTGAQTVTGTQVSKHQSWDSLRLWTSPVLFALPR